MINKKLIWIVVIFILIVLIPLIKTNQINLVQPRGNIIDRYPKFIWSGDYDEYNLLVSNTNSFENPLIDLVLENNSFRSNRLDYGQYYWKIIGIKNNKTFETETIKFTIDSAVSFSMKDSTFKNIGNVESRLSSLTGFVILNPNQEIELENKTYKLEQE